MELKKYIEQIGDEAAAILFGVTVRAAASWRRGERVPSRAKAALIVKATKGRVGYDDIWPKTGLEK